MVRPHPNKINEARKDGINLLAVTQRARPKPKSLESMFRIEVPNTDRVEGGGMGNRMLILRERHSL
jgi:hypothetical protein